jgi:hypothetical protein
MIKLLQKVIALLIVSSVAAAVGSHAASAAPTTSCQITQSACPVYPPFSGTFVDVDTDSANNQSFCMQRASDYYSFCGITPASGVTTTATYLSNGQPVQSVTVGNSGYEIAQSGSTVNNASYLSGAQSIESITQNDTGCQINAVSCPAHPAFQGSFSDNYNGSGSSQSACMGRASAYYSWCQIPQNSAGTVTATYVSGGQVLQSTTAGNSGCQITQSACPFYPPFSGTFWDFTGITTSAPYLQAFCMQRAAEYQSWCRIPAGSGITTTAAYISNGVVLQSITANNPSSSATPAALTCGSVVTANTVLTQDLNCPNTTGYAIRVLGDHVTLDGNGHNIIAPQAAAGVYVQGTGDTVEDIQVSGGATYGIFAYDSPSLSVLNNRVSQNQIGIELYAENTVMSNVLVRGNAANGNSVFGLQTKQDGAGSIELPKIQYNDFSQSGSYALSISASDFELSGASFNNLSGSLNGLFLQTGNFSIHDLSLSTQLLQQAQIEAFQAASVNVSAVDVSTSLAPNPIQEHTGVALHRVGEFNVSQVTAWNSDEGVRITTDQGYASSGSVSTSQFIQNHYAGITVLSYDRTPFVSLNFSGNNLYREPSGVSSEQLNSATTVIQHLQP